MVTVTMIVIVTATESDSAGGYLVFRLTLGIFQQHISITQWPHLPVLSLLVAITNTNRLHTRLRDSSCPDIATLLLLMIIHQLPVLVLVL